MMELGRATGNGKLQYALCEQEITSKGAVGRFRAANYAVLQSFMTLTIELLIDTGQGGLRAGALSKARHASGSAGAIGRTAAILMIAIGPVNL